MTNSADPAQVMSNIVKMWPAHLKNDPENAIHVTVIILSWVGIVVKIIALFMIGFLDWGSIKASLPNQLKQRLNSDYAPQVDDVPKV